jgi:hypothetical protein
VLIYVGVHPDDYTNVMESDIIELLKILGQKRFDLRCFIKDGEQDGARVTGKAHGLRSTRGSRLQSYIQTPQY